MKIYGYEISPNVRKVLVALSHKDLEHELVLVRPRTRTPEWLAISPLGLVPAIEDGGQYIADSAVIVEYLDERYPSTPLLPADPGDRARSRWLTAYAGDVLSSRVVPVAQNAAKEAFRYTTVDPAQLRKAEDELLPEAFEYLEAQVPKDGFLFGPLGIADISIVSPIINCEYAGYAVEETRWPLLAAFTKRVKAQDAFAKCLERERRQVALVLR